jgi:hypothetical protein
MPSNERENHGQEGLLDMVFLLFLFLGDKEGNIDEYLTGT